MIHTTDKDTIGITIEIENTNTTQDTNNEVTTTRTGRSMIIIKIETGLTTEGNLTNTNTTETNQKHKSSWNTPIKISWKSCIR